MKLFQRTTTVVIAFYYALCTSVYAQTCIGSCPEILAPVCGSDGKTYDNKCLFEYEKCMSKNSELTIVSEGECSNGGNDNKCDDIICIAAIMPVCGSDNKTYQNECKFGIAQCKDKSLTLVKKEACDTSAGSASSGEGCEKPCLKIYKPVCGSDNKTYGNDCELKNAQCSNKELTLVSETACGSSSGSGNVSPSPDNSSSDACNTMCPMDFAPVCGSDGQTYSNMCKFENAQCKDKTLTLKSETACEESRSFSNDGSVAGEIDCEEPCTKEIDYICGSDGNTYNNECLFRNAQCLNNSLTKASAGECPENATADNQTAGSVANAPAPSPSKTNTGVSVVGFTAVVSSLVAVALSALL